jgi:protein transport protein SEC61 subunit alpha
MNFLLIGLAYYLSPPREISDIIKDPIHTLIYLIFICGACAIFARYWIEISGEGPKEVAKK